MTAKASRQNPSSGTRRLRGQTAYLAGLAAENAVERAYQQMGAQTLETRWRGKGGEIDMILQHGTEIVFCEVKKATTFDEGKARLRPQQMQRIHASASEYLAKVQDGQLASVRFDLAVADESGQVTIQQSAFSHF